MGVTLYNYPAYNYEGDNSKCLHWWGEPCEAIDSTTLGVFGTMPAYWDDDVDSIKIEPENAYRWCGWNDPGQRGNRDCYTRNVPEVTSRWYSSYSVQKNCSHSDFTWDDSCLNPSDGDRYYGNNYENRKNMCQSDLNAHPRCRAWCETNPHECTASITKYCTDLGDSNIDQMVNDNFCKNNSAGGVTHSDRIKADKCQKDANLFGTNACQQYCKDNKNCDRSIQTYCANDMNQICQEFCKDESIDKCTAAIRNHCFKNDSANMSTPYCKTAVVAANKRGANFDTEMREYCNLIPNILGSGSGRQRNLSNMEISAAVGKTASEIDTLENPVCACFDEKLIQKKFSSISNEEKRNLLNLNPVCFLGNCKNDPKAYQKKMSPGGNCEIVLCDIDIKKLTAIQTTNIKIQNNCGQGSASNDPLLGITEGTSSTTTGNKDCKKTKCDKLLDQLKSSYFNYDHLNDDNKRIFVALICLIFFLLFFIIYMSSSD
jgi:hypothetical protein